MLQNNGFSVKAMFAGIKRGEKGGKGGAGEGNRTPVISLEGWSFTTKQHPHKE